MYGLACRPALEYASFIWDPYLNKNILAIKMVQKRLLVGRNLIIFGPAVLQQCSVIFIDLLSHIIEKYQDL